MTQQGMRRAAPAIPACIAAAMLIFASATCTPYTQPTNAKPTIMHGANTSGSLMVALTERGAKGIKGSLEDDEKATQKYFLTLGWGDDLPDSAVWEGPWGANDVMIRLVPASTSPVVAWGDALTSDSAKYSGHLVMKIIVLEDKEVRNLGLKGLETGYLWIGQRGKGNSRGLGAAIYTIKPNGKPDLAMEMVISGMCKEDHGGRAMAYAREPGKCKDPIPPAAASSAGGFASFSSYRMRAGPPPLVGRLGLWVTCTGGCCEVSSVNTAPE
jgi:hypothetical protein